MLSENVIYCVQDVHEKELVKRIKWSVKIRWYYLAVSSLLILAAYHSQNFHGINLNYFLLIAANIFLIFCNLFYQYKIKFCDIKCPGTSELRYALIFQIMSDYLALMLVVYTLGSIEIPIMLMIIPNTILATLFFTSRQSLLITLMGVILLITPLILEYFYLIPRVSLFAPEIENSFKIMLLSEPVFLIAYCLMFLACVLFCWYLLCSITTRLINNELELEQSYQDMLKLDKEKTYATLRSTHELKAPLAAIKNYVYTINAGYAGDINDQLLKIINRIGKRCDYLLNNVTDIIKLGNLKSYVVSENNFYPVNLVSFIDTFIAQNKDLVFEKQITINSHNFLSEHNSMIMANEENLQLIISNLFNNAVNYSYDKGIIDISLSEQQEMLCVSIEDYGIGIEDKLIDKLFDEHFRATNAVNFYEGGTGLGLSIVKVCSKILHAKIKISSKLNQGTTVLICFHAEK
ncbi:MAG: HAMP domain-containing histidine kinase [Thiotrichaceae bacterium]|nr:HAMP domain-containing histidine kinase [Thiotrichaceae bacterium]